MELYDYVNNQLNELAITDDNKIAILTQTGIDAGTEYISFLFTKSFKELKKELSEYIGNPIIIGIIKNKYGYSMYICKKKTNSEEWLCIPYNTPIYSVTPTYIKEVIDRIIEFVKKYYDEIDGIFDKRFQNFLLELILENRGIIVSGQ